MLPAGRCWRHPFCRAFTGRRLTTTAAAAGAAATQPGGPGAGGGLGRALCGQQSSLSAGRRGCHIGGAVSLSAVYGANCRWKAAGLDRLELDATTARLQQQSAEAGQDGCALIECRFLLRPAEQQAEGAAAEEEGVGVGEVSAAGREGG